MTFLNFLTPLLSLGAGWLTEQLNAAILFIEGIVYEAVSYVYLLFTLITQLNFNSIYAIVGPIVEKIEAVIMVLIVFKLGMTLVGMLLNPDGAFAQGKALLVNIMVTVALLISYNFIFSLLNEVGMLVIGAPPGYNFPVISGITGQSISADGGIINRFVFGKEGNMDAVGDMGEYMAYQIASIFIVNQTDEDTLGKTIEEDDGYNFLLLPNLSPEVDRKVKYTPFIGVLVGGYMIYVFVKISLEVGQRMFKLLVLQLVAPLAIVTIITEGVSSKGFKGTMSKFISTYLSVFAEVFIRVLFTLLVTVFVSKFIMNLGDFFGDISAAGDDFLTKGLLTIIVLIAGYKFVLEIPKLLSSVFGGKFSVSGGDDFGKYALGLVGGATGMVTGAVGGAMAGGSVGSRITGALAGGFAGAGGGFMTGSRGQSAADAVKNSYNQTQKRNQDWKDRGGFGNVVVGAGNDVIGRTKLQDRKMNKYQEQMDAVDAYDKASAEYKDSVNQAQVEAIKGTAMSASDEFVVGRDSSGQEIRKSANDVYDSGYENIHLGESAEGYAQKVVEYDKQYQKTQAQLEAARASGDASLIEDAQRKNIAARREATQRATDYWNSKKNTANVSVDSSKLEQAQHDANKKLGRAQDDVIDVKATRQQIKQEQKKIQDTRGYKATHPQSNNGGGGGH